MKTLLAALSEKAKGNPVGVVLASLAIAVYGGGEALSEMAVEPWGTIVKGVGGLLCLVAGAWVARSKPPEDPK
jgi:hypothetical protein